MNDVVAVNTVAPITNVGVCMQAMTRLLERDHFLPGMALFYGPAGYGKSMAASYVANKTRAYYISCKSSWTKKALLLAVLKEMGVDPARTLYEMTDQISEQLVLSERPLIIDEVDHIVEKKSVEIIRDLYEGSQASILLIGEERSPNKLQKWERFHRRILEFAPAQPASKTDISTIAKLYSPDVEIASDLIKVLKDKSAGSIGRAAVNISRIHKFGKREGLSRVDVATWGKQDLYTGQAPVRGAA